MCGRDQQYSMSNRPKTNSEAYTEVQTSKRLYTSRQDKVGLCTFVAYIIR